MNGRDIELSAVEESSRSWKENVKRECLGNWRRDSRISPKVYVVATRFLDKILEAPSYRKLKLLKLTRAFRILIRSSYGKFAISSYEHGLIASEIIESLAKNGQLRLALTLYWAHDTIRPSAGISRNVFRRTIMSLFSPLLYLTSLLTVHTYLLSWAIPRFRERLIGK